VTPVHAANRTKLRGLPVRRRLPPRVRRAYDLITRESPGTAERLQRFGLAPVDVVEVPVDELLVQRPVLCELVPAREAAPIEFLDRYFETPGGGSDWRISRSMQYRLLEQHARDALPGDLRETDYWRWHSDLDRAGINERPEEWVRGKVEGLIALYESIREHGYRYGDLRTYVWALNEPLVRTRYGFDHHPAGFEIYDGHHRAAAAAKLGHETLRVLLLRDVADRTPFGVPLSEVVVPGR
jgi:hypothetical protein